MNSKPSVPAGLALPMVAGGASFLDDRVEVGASVGEEPLSCREISRLHQRMLVIGLQLDDLLVDGGGFDALPLRVQRVGNLDEPFDRLVDLAGARIEVAEGVCRAPVGGLIGENAEVLCYGSFNLSGAKQLLGVSDGFVAIE